MWHHIPLWRCQSRFVDGLRRTLSESFPSFFEMHISPSSSCISKCTAIYKTLLTVIEEEDPVQPIHHYSQRLFISISDPKRSQCGLRRGSADMKEANMSGIRIYLFCLLLQLMASSPIAMFAFVEKNGSVLVPEPAQPAAADRVGYKARSYER